MTEDQKFKYIFWFLITMSGIAMVYFFLITFCHIPKENIRFADTLQGFFTGVVITGVFGYLVTGNAHSFRNTKGTGSGTTTADISAVITTTEDMKTDEAVKDPKIKGGE